MKFYSEITKTLVPIKFEGINPQATNLGGVKYFPSLLGPQANQHRVNVLDEYERLVLAGKLQGWAEDYDADGHPTDGLFKYLQKEIYQVQLPNGNLSLPFLKYVPISVLE